MGAVNSVPELFLSLLGSFLHSALAIMCPASPQNQTLNQRDGHIRNFGTLVAPS